MNKRRIINQQKNAISLARVLTTFLVRSYYNNIIVVIMLCIACGFSTGCLSSKTTTQIGSANPVSDSVVIVYTGRLDSTKMLSLKILNYNRYPGVAHPESTKHISTSKPCDTAFRGICLPTSLGSHYNGLVGVIYMNDNEVYQKFSQIHSWANDCGHVYVEAYFDDGLRLDYMFLNKFDSIINRSELRGTSLVIYEKFIAEIRHQDSISPLGCM